MELKKFYADNMQEALKKIKNDLGPDAVIISSKMVRAQKGLKGIFSKKMIEVVVSYDDTDNKKKPGFTYSRPSFSDSVPPFGEKPVFSENKPVFNTNQNGNDTSKSSKDFLSELQSSRMNREPANSMALDEKIGEIKEILSQFTDKMGYYNNVVEPTYTPEVNVLYKKLVDNDMDRDLAHEVCLETQQISDKMNAQPEEVLRSILKDILGQPMYFQHTKYRQRVIMLVGPTGVGKTTTLVKMASFMAVKDRLNVGIINTDVYRVAAQEHLKAYSEILNTTLKTIYKPEEIKEALREMDKMDVILIDTAGKLSKDQAYQEELKCLVEVGDIDEIYLTVSASTSDKVLRSIIKDYEFLKDFRVIVSKMDEVLNRGILFFIAKISRRPLSYITTGQNVPDDIMQVNPDEVIDSILRN
ncbi:MAG: flagellar biosynthesis protein FlhF [Eubacteriales bacterium]